MIRRNKIKYIKKDIKDVRNKKPKDESEHVKKIRIGIEKTIKEIKEQEQKIEQKPESRVPRVKPTKKYQSRQEPEVNYTENKPLENPAYALTYNEAQDEIYNNKPERIDSHVKSILCPQGHNTVIVTEMQKMAFILFCTTCKKQYIQYDNAVGTWHVVDKHKDSAYYK